VAGGLGRAFFGRLREQSPFWVRVLLASSSIALIIFVWWLATRGVAEERVISPAILESPGETLASFKSLWFDRALTRNLVWSLWRVLQGFGLAALVGVPIGIAAGTFRPLESFLAPITMFGRNVPISALVPLTLLWFGIEETQKVMFIFIASVAFVTVDATRSTLDVEERYVETAYTLGASRWQVVRKVIIPLALPDVFNSLRLLFGLAFGYIILAEMVNMDRGLGTLILISQRRGPKAHVYLILILIALVAFGIDRGLQALGRSLFAYKYAREA